LLRSLLRPLTILAVLTALAAYATITLRGPQGLSALSQKRREIRALEEQNANLRRDIEAKKQRIDRLKNDPGTQEVEVQKHLGKVRPGVTEFRELGQRVSSDGSNAPERPADQAKPAQR
jgi:cell division protein FtsB